MRILAFISFLGCLILPLSVVSQDAEVVQEGRLNAEALFAPDHIVDIEIEMPSADWDTIRLQSRSFGEALGAEPAETPFTYVKANVTVDGVLIEDVGVRKKGFLGSLNDRRPSLKIKFSEYVKQSPIQGLDRLTLNNNNQDPGRICQFLSYKFYNESGTVAPRCNFAKVTVNGTYLGIYSNVESVRTPFLERGFGDSSGSLFEGTVSDFFVDRIRRFEKKNKQAKYGQLKKLARIIESDPVNLEELEEVLDVEAFIRFWAMESLIGFWDGYCNNQNNYFVYRHPENDRFYFIPWGTDSAFSESMPLPPYRVRPRSVHCQAIIPNKLYRIPEVQQRYVDTLMGFLDEHWNEEELLAEIDRLESMLTDVVMERNTGFSTRLASYRKFVETRREDIMREFKRRPPKIRTRERIPAYFARIGTAQLTFETQWYDDAPEDISGVGNVDVELVLDGELVEWEEVGVMAESSKWPSSEAVKPPSIVISGTRKSDGKRLTLGTGLSIDLFKPTHGESVDIGGIFMIDNAFVNEFGQMRMIGGSATFESTSMKDGESVTGTMDLHIMEMRGGRPDKREKEQDDAKQDDAKQDDVKEDESGSGK